MRAKPFIFVLSFLAVTAFVSIRAEDKSTSSTVQVEPVSDGRTEITVEVPEGDSKVSTKVNVTVKDFNGQSIYFRRDVMPLLTALGCNAAKCHGSVGSGSGLRLSMFAANPQADYTMLTRGAEGRHINNVEPEKSLLLLKATAAIPHGGKQKIKKGSPQYNMLISWITTGARWGDDKEPQLVSVEIYPTERIMQKGQTQRHLATAFFSDGTQKDVTDVARYQSIDEAVAEVDDSGKVTANEFGQSTIVVTYMRKYALARIVVPQKLPEPFPEFKANNEIDKHVLAKLKELGFLPSDICSDHEFLRRVYLDVIGTLPTADQARAFLADSDAKKRSRLIDELLQREEFADFWAMKWGDLFKVKSEYPSNLWPNAVQAYHQWIRDSIAQNKPYDQFVRELIVSCGSNFRNGPVNFYRAFLKRDAQNLADATALIFMGVRIGCASCHGHPVEEWTLEDNLGMAAFFAKVGYKRTLEWKEEIVYFNPKGSLRHPATRELIKPTFLNGQTLELDSYQDPRVKFAEWLISPDNPWFAKNIVNRIWFWLFGKGIVEQPDDMRPTNPPSNPELLAYLEKELIDHKYDLKHIYRLISNSRTYQLSSKPDDWNVNDKAYFSHYPARRLGAEQLLDAIGQITETSERYISRVPEPYTMVPVGHRAVQISDGSIQSPFLELFGRPSRDTPYESERSCETSMRQALHFINSRWLQSKINASPRLKRLMKPGNDDAGIVEEIYLMTLSRFPAEDEKKSVLEYIQADKKYRTQAIQDFVWAIMNTKEFMFNH